VPYNATAQSIMQEFADATGLSNNARAPRRYLWTDAFAVCNYLAFFKHTGDKSFLELAIKLVDQVHATLGQHRKDSGHSGWISGLSEEQARLYPTFGGLRIGKKLDERKAEKPDA
jgi:rhamnogalacturonyl hydrolase YesR